MRYLLLAVLAFSLVSCKDSITRKTPSEGTTLNFKEAKEEINQTLTTWHQAAANADYDTYFGKMTADAVFIGTDPTENWQGEEFREWSKPYFDRGRAWSFSTLERNIYFSGNACAAWFDELLDTQMGICRGSGVMVKDGGEWKLQHYVLSIAIPNEDVDTVTSLKKEFDTRLISELRQR